LGGASGGDVIIDIECSLFLLALNLAFSQIPISALREKKRFVAGKSYTRKRGVSLMAAPLIPMTEIVTT